MYKKNLLISTIATLSLILSGCGSESSNDTTTATTQTLSGVAIDGYLSHAKVCIDINANNQCDTNEPSTTTDGNGSYSLDTTIQNLSQYNVIVEAIVGETVDSDNPATPIQKAFFLKTSADTPEVISPMTTLIQNTLEINSSLTKEEAVNKVKQDLNISETIDITADYIQQKQADIAYDKVHKVAQVVTELIAKTLDNTDTTATENFDKVTQVILTDITTKLPVIATEVEKEDFNKDSFVAGIDINATLAEDENTSVQNTTSKIMKRLTSSSQTGGYSQTIEYSYNGNNLNYAVSIVEQYQDGNGNTITGANVYKFSYDNYSGLNGIFATYDANFTTLENVDFSNATTKYNFMKISENSYDKGYYIERYGEHTVPLNAKQKAYTPEELTLMYIAPYNASVMMSINDGKISSFEFSDNSGNYIISSPIYDANNTLIQAVSDDDIYRLNYTYNTDGLLDELSVYKKFADGSVDNTASYVFTYAEVAGKKRLVKTRFYDKGFFDGHIEINEYRYELDETGYVKTYTFAYDIGGTNEGNITINYTWEQIQ